MKNATMLSLDLSGGTGGGECATCVFVKHPEMATRANIHIFPIPLRNNQDTIYPAQGTFCVLENIPDHDGN
jgi:hypothetical protein